MYDFLFYVEAYFSAIAGWRGSVRDAQLRG
jgi:hypothetical protein